MKSKIKELIEVYRIWKVLNKSQSIFIMVERIFKFIQETHDQKKPMVTEIALVNMANGTKVSDFVSLWAGIGDANPIKRVSHLKAQNIELKRLLELSSNGLITEEDKKQIEIVLRYFD